MIEELKCYIKNQHLLQMFVIQVAKRLTLGPPYYFDQGVIYSGPVSEIQRLKLFYEGMIFYEKYRNH
jgi:hypothetical protein